MPNINTSSTLTKSYLIYRFYDKNNVLLCTEFRLLSSGAGANWENLQINNFEVEANGTLEVFVFNESSLNIYFDDISIIHTPLNYRKFKRIKLVITFLQVFYLQFFEEK